MVMMYCSHVSAALKAVTLLARHTQRLLVTLRKSVQHYVSDGI